MLKKFIKLAWKKPSVVNKQISASLTARQTRYFPTDYKYVIQVALLWIKQLDIIKYQQYKKIFRDILSNRGLNKEEREARVLFTLFKVVGYLRSAEGANG